MDIYGYVVSTIAIFFIIKAIIAMFTDERFDDLLASWWMGAIVVIGIVLLGFLIVWAMKI